MKNRRKMDSGQGTDVLAVAELMMTASIDQIVTYEDMSRVADCDVRKKRWIVIQAKTLINREHGVVMAPRRGIGYRRLGSLTGVKHAGEKAMKRTRSAAKNGRKTLENALERANDITPSDQRHAYQRVTSLGMIEYLSQDKVVRAMQDEPVKRAALDLSALKKALGY